jgi:hypothetical protein
VKGVVKQTPLSQEALFRASAIRRARARTYIRMAFVTVTALRERVESGS